jgi:hypothetical protein
MSPEVRRGASFPRRTFTYWTSLALSLAEAAKAFDQFMAGQ